MDAVYRFDGFEIRPCERRVFHRGQPLAIGPRAFDLLMVLVSQRDRVVSRAELLDAVWPCIAVEDANLSVQVAALRRALGAGPIATVPGRGYRFVAVTQESGESGKAQLHTAASRVNHQSARDLVEAMATFCEDSWRETQPSSAAELQRMLHDVRTTLAWALSPAGDRVVGVHLLTCSGWLWEALNLTQEGATHWASFAADAVENADYRGQAGFCLARLLGNIGFGFSPDLPRIAARAVACARLAKDPRMLHGALVATAITCARAGKLQLAEAALAEATTGADSQWPKRFRATRFLAMAEVSEARNDLRAARVAQARRIELLFEAGAQSVILHAQSQLLGYAVAEGRADDAADEAQGILAGTSMQCATFRSRGVRLALADALLHLGQWREAEEVMRQALPMLSGAGAKWQALDLLARLRACQGDAEVAGHLDLCSTRFHAMHGLWRRPYRREIKPLALGRIRTAWEPALYLEEEALALALGEV